MIKNFSWQQLAVLVICLAAAFAAHKFLGLEQGMAAGVVTSIVAFMLGRSPQPSSEEPKE
jgi:MFS superfamily sulfate permease-like transporter